LQPERSKRRFRKSFSASCPPAERKLPIRCRRGRAPRFCPAARSSNQSSFRRWLMATCAFKAVTSAEFIANSWKRSYSLMRIRFRLRCQICICQGIYVLIYNTRYGRAEILFAGKTLPRPGRLYPAEIAEPYEWPGGLCLLLCGNTENQPAEDLTASSVSSAGWNCGCAARRQMDALPARATTLARGRRDSRSSTTCPAERQKVCGRPRAPEAGLLPTATLCHSARCSTALASCEIRITA